MTILSEIDTQVIAVYKRDDITSAVRYFWYNRAIKNIVALNDVEESRDTYRGTLSTGSYYFAAPDDKKTIRSILLEYTSTEFRDLGAPLTKRQLDSQYPDLPNMTASHPREWAVDGNKFWIIPPTDADYVVRMHLEHFFATLVASDTIPISNVEDLIVHRSLDLLFGLHRESEAQREYHQARADMLEIKLFPSSRERTRGGVMRSV